MDLNGQRCMVEGASRQTGRFRVHLLNCASQLDIRGENLVTEEVYDELKEVAQAQADAEVAVEYWHQRMEHELMDDPFAAEEEQRRGEEALRLDIMEAENEYWDEVLRMRRTPPTYSLDMVMEKYPDFDPNTPEGAYCRGD